MPRNHNAGPSTLRNRNRVTNKTRLKVITESIDADPIVLDEDEEKARVVSTAGVDAEDANEHHLQAVLSAAATRHQSTARYTRGKEKEKPAPAAYIPTPDSTGLVDNYEELYAPGRWKDPSTYLKFSDTVEESTLFALSHSFIYYMDERDKEWLDRNNAEAGGEGTSAQGAMSGAGTRSGRGSKAKGKDLDVPQPLTMSEDEFELVMAIFEKVTHEKTEFLHHVSRLCLTFFTCLCIYHAIQGLEQGTPFPPFNDYQDTFAEELNPSMFALYSVPDWVPTPAHLSRLALAIYPHWRERRTERGGHPIIPAVNVSGRQFPPQAFSWTECLAARRDGYEERVIHLFQTTRNQGHQEDSCSAGHLLGQNGAPPGRAHHSFRHGEWCPTTRAAQTGNICS